MSTIFLNSDHVEVRTVSANVKGTRAVVKVELVVNGPHELGFVIEEFERAKTEMQRRRAEKAAASKKPKNQRAIEQQQLLAIPYFGDRS